MQRFGTRRVVVVGLAFLLHLSIAYGMMAGRRAVQAASDLAEARRWLKGTVVVIDPGHGGDDPGAVVGPTLEKDVVLQIALVLKQTLEQQGTKVILTRDEDEDLGGPIRVELGKRVALIDRNKAHVFVSIHANKDSCNCWGAQTFYQKDSLPSNKELALALQNQLRLLTPTTRGALSADYFVLRNSPVPAAMVEVGFLTHGRERQQLQEPAYQQTLARAIALGLADFIRSQVPPADAGGSVGR